MLKAEKDIPNLLRAVAYISSSGCVKRLLHGPSYRIYSAGPAKRLLYIPNSEIQDACASYSVI